MVFFLIPSSCPSLLCVCFSTPVLRLSPGIFVCLIFLFAHFSHLHFSISISGPFYLTIKLPLAVCEEKIALPLKPKEIANPIGSPSFRSCYVSIKELFLVFLSSCSSHPVTLSFILEDSRTGQQAFSLEDQIAITLDFASLDMVSVTVTQPCHRHRGQTVNGQCVCIPIKSHLQRTSFTNLRTLSWCLSEFLPASPLGHGFPR